MRVLTLLLTLVFAGLTAPAFAAEFSDGEKTEIETIVRDYLLANPEVLEEAFSNLQERRRAEESQAQQQAVTDNRSLLLNSSRQAVIGNPDGDVTLVEFFDYNCGYCRRANDDLKRLIDENPDLRVVLKEFPVLGPPSVEAAQVAIAVNDVAPDRYGEFHDTLISSDGRVDGAAALALVREMGIDTAAVEAAMEDDNVQATIEEVYGLANALGLTGTPSYVVGDSVMVGAVGFETLQAEVNKTTCGELSC
ncbi:DsbA family protein [Amorphus orientalis]|uniref:Protein-disulfide isomerase n=1 Tax=Amorphus orientalis TaxID=649198 RepID=A0AAE3VMN8_9HYPH|nr:DsbA family protein [Amorphus orientalis]MDQ0314780.1 protein-disulfide isomerase [Amorphus orientalis]